MQLLRLTPIELVTESLAKTTFMAQEAIHHPCFLLFQQVIRSGDMIVLVHLQAFQRVITREPKLVELLQYIFL